MSTNAQGAPKPGGRCTEPQPCGGSECCGGHHYLGMQEIDKWLCISISIYICLNREREKREREREERERERREREREKRERERGKGKKL